MTPLLLTIPLLAAAPIPKEFKGPVTLDGKWKVTAYESSGRAIKSTSILSQTWVFHGDTLTIAGENPDATPTSMTYRADSKATPMAIEYVLRSGTTRRGVFAVNGDTLTVCLGTNATVGVRPENVDGGPGTVKYTLSRIKDTSPTPEACR